MITYGHAFEELTGRDESYAEFDELKWRGKSYVLRVTMLYPYKDYANNKDDLRCHIDFMNVSDGTSGRFHDVIIPGRNLNEPEGHLRRWSAIRKLKELVQEGTTVPSPVYP